MYSQTHNRPLHTDVILPALSLALTSRAPSNGTSDNPTIERADTAVKLVSLLQFPSYGTNATAGTNEIRKSN